jgi:hypothetical protein
MLNGRVARDIYKEKHKKELNKGRVNLPHLIHIYKVDSYNLLI